MSAHPILNPCGWGTNPWLQKTPPEPKKHPKYLQNICFQSLFFGDWDPVVQCTFSKSAHKPIFLYQLTPFSTPKGGSPVCVPRGPHKNPKTTQNSLKKHISCACFQVIKIQLHTPNLHTNYFFSVCPPHSQPWGWVTHPWPKGTPSEPKNNQKYLKKNLFPKHNFELLRSKCTSSNPHKN